MNKSLTSLRERLRQRVNQHNQPMQKVDPNYNPTPIGAEDLIELLDGLEAMYLALNANRESGPTS